MYPKIAFSYENKLATPIPNPDNAPPNIPSPPSTAYPIMPPTTVPLAPTTKEPIRAPIPKAATPPLPMKTIPVATTTKATPTPAKIHCHHFSE